MKKIFKLIQSDNHKHLYHKINKRSSVKNL